MIVSGLTHSATIHFLARIAYFWPRRVRSGENDGDDATSKTRRVGHDEYDGGEEDGSEYDATGMVART